MNTGIQPQQAQISPLAILAAILFNINKTELIKIKADDSDNEIEVLTQCVGIEQEGEALVCVIPLEKIAKYASIPYSFQMRVDNGHALISFEKQEQSGLLTATGKRAATESAAIHNLIRKLQLGSEVTNESKDTK